MIVKLCACGCGEPVGVAKGYDRVHGITPGTALTYIHGHNRRKNTLAERLWSHVVKTDDCWNWTGATSDFGHGLLMGSDRRHIRAHRLSWELANGAVPAGLCVLHRCDNPRRVRPDHLFLGTKKDNTQDMMRKGRHRPGGRWKRGAA